MPSHKPRIFVGIKATGNAVFFVESLRANLGEVPNAVGQYEGKTPEFVVPIELVARYIDIRVRVRVLSGTSQVAIYGWSSKLRDNPETPRQDERWRRLTTGIVSASPVSLSASFDPLETGE